MKPDPDQPPFPVPVKFDRVAAQAALEALQRSIADLKSRTVTDLKNASIAKDAWTGPHRERFAGYDVPWMQREASRVLDGMLKLHGAIAGAMQNAAELQRQHDLANQRWHEGQKQPK